MCFDAKECAADTFPLQNLHEHQVRFMKEFEEQGGIAFIILFYTKRNEMYYMPFSDVLIFWERMQRGGRKSFTYDEVEKSYRIFSKGEYLCHYLEALSKDLESRHDPES